MASVDGYRKLLWGNVFLISPVFPGQRERRQIGNGAGPDTTVEGNEEGGSGVLESIWSASASAPSNRVSSYGRIGDSTGYLPTDTLSII